MIKSTRGRRLRASRGTVSVEMAMVVPVLILMLFGIIEFGMMFSTVLQLNNLTREGARIASVGARPAEVVIRMLGAATHLDAQDMTILMEYRTFAGGYWSSWSYLGDDGYNNTAPPGSQLRVRTTYNYHLLMGRLFSRFADDVANNTKTLTSTMVMRRE